MVSFSGKNNCNACYNVIYNTSPLVLMHHFTEIQRLTPEAVRLSFTVENEKKMEQVFSYIGKLYGKEEGIAGTIF